MSDFSDAINAWLNPKPDGSRSRWIDHWLQPECTFLKYSREHLGGFDAPDAKQLQRLLEHDHESSAKTYYDNPPGKGSGLTSRAADQMQGMAWAVEAARRYLNAADAVFLEAARESALAYQRAWLVSRPSTEPAESLNPFTDANAGGTIRAALQPLLGRDGVTIVGYLAVKRLLEYVLEEARPDRAPPVASFQTTAHLPVIDEADESRRRGACPQLEITSAAESGFAFFLDPVALGLTVVDFGMLRSLDAAWTTACLPALRQRIHRDRQSPLAIRLAPHAPGAKCLGGQSAGLLFACGMYAAAEGMELDPHCTASIRLDPDHPLRLMPVAEKSLPAKLTAARDAGMECIVLENDQAERAKQLPERGRLQIIGVSTLADAYRALTRKAAEDRRMEAVLEKYCQAKVAAWDKLRANPEDIDGHYVEPHYATLPEGYTPFDISERLARRADPEKAPPDPYVRVPGGDVRALASLLTTSRLLCVTEDAGTGKSIFTHRAQAFLSTPLGWSTLTAGQPCLAVRWESTWPSNVVAGLRKKLAEVPDCRQAATGVDPLAVVRWALDHQRVVLILDALDQVTRKVNLPALAEFLESPAGQQCRVVLTSRSFEVPQKRETMFRSQGWRFARIEGFDEAQQAKYLAGLFRESLDELIPNRAEVAELLRFPVLLRLVRQLAESGQLKKFAHRGDLYLQASAYLIKRAAEKSDPNFDSDDVETLERMLAACAFVMMTQRQYQYVVRGRHLVRRLKDHAGKLCVTSVGREQWRMVKRATSLTNRCILEGIQEDMLGWKHRGMMEFYCGLYLARYAPEECVDRMRPLANDPQWYWAWRFAIESPPDESEPESLCRSLAVLYERPQQGLRPTELMYRAWEVLESLTEGRTILQQFRDEFRELVEKGHPIALRLVPDEPEQHVAGSLRDSKSVSERPNHVGAPVPERPGYLGQQVSARRDHVRPNFMRCPKNPNDDRVPFSMDTLDDAPEVNGNERPHHEVVVSPSWIQTVPVKRREFELFDARCAAWQSRVRRYPDAPDCPVIMVTWYEAWVFARWIGGRLPTRAEWQYARRMGALALYYRGVRQNRDGETDPIGGFLRALHDAANKLLWGDGETDSIGKFRHALCKLHREMGGFSCAGFCEDLYDVLRGGGWNDDCAKCRSSPRSEYPRGTMRHLDCFRVCVGV